MTEPTTPLDDLRYHWGEAYEITNQPGWRARRRDGQGGWLSAPDPETLREMIRLNYQAGPVPRDE